MPRGVYKHKKGYKLTPEQVTKKFTPEVRKKMSLAKLNRVLSEETKMKMSSAHIGKNTGENNYQWKGENAGYSSIHKYLYKHLGKAEKCTICGVTRKDKRIDWANRSRRYLRDLKDWVSLCRSCHVKADKNNINLTNI